MISIRFDKKLNECYNEYDFVIVPVKHNDIYKAVDSKILDASIYNHLNKINPSIKSLINLSRMVLYKKRYRIDYASRISFVTINKTRFYFLSAYRGIGNNTIDYYTVKDYIPAIINHYSSTYKEKLTLSYAIMPFAINSKTNSIQEYKIQIFIAIVNSYTKMFNMFERHGIILNLDICFSDNNQINPVIMKKLYEFCENNNINIKVENNA